MLDVLVDLAYGDSGKGKCIDFLASHYKYDVVARWGGGPNAGHTLYKDEEKIVLHSLPSGVLSPNTKNFIGSGCVVNIDTLVTEIQEIKKVIDTTDRLFISEEVQLIIPEDIEKDKGSYNKTIIGTTGKGVGPAYMRRAERRGVKLKNSRLSLEKLKGLITVVPYDYLHPILEKNGKVIAEGAQGTWLDVDYGDYPAVTSSNTISASACVGLAVPPRVRNIFGVFKAYETRVGGSRLDLPMEEDLAKIVREKGKEYGATTGRPRHLGWLSISALIRAMKLNGVTIPIMTKADVLNNMPYYKLYQPKWEPTDYFSVLVLSGWAALASKEFQIAKTTIEREISSPITLVSSGPGRFDWA